jgi:hypothetical protein
MRHQNARDPMHRHPEVFEVQGCVEILGRFENPYNASVPQMKQRAIAPWLNQCPSNIKPSTKYISN